MPSASRPSFLRPFSRARASQRMPDWGDMGTAFGLDHALDEAPAPPTVAAPAPPPMPVSGWRLWLGRKLRA